MMHTNITHPLTGNLLRTYSLNHRVAALWNLCEEALAVIGCVTRGAVPIDFIIGTCKTQWQRLDGMHRRCGFIPDIICKS
jgi:hypothetical protein